MPAWQSTEATQHSEIRFKWAKLQEAETSEARLGVECGLSLNLIPREHKNLQKGQRCGYFLIQISLSYCNFKYVWTLYAWLYNSTTFDRFQETDSALGLRACQHMGMLSLAQWVLHGGWTTAALERFFIVPFSLWPWGLREGYSACSAFIAAQCTFLYQRQTALHAPKWVFPLYFPLCNNQSSLLRSRVKNLAKT